MIVNYRGFNNFAYYVFHITECRLSSSNDRPFHKYGLLITRQLLQATRLLPNGEEVGAERSSSQHLFVSLQWKIAIVRPYV